MANEITVTLNLTVANANKSTTRTFTKQITQSNSGFDPQKVTATTGGNNVTLVGLTTEGWIWIQNLDATNFVDFGQDNASTIQPIGRLQPGEAGCFRLKPAETLRVQANTASCDLELLVLEA